MEGQRRVLLCPAGGKGHVSPMIVLGKRLAELGLSIAFCCVSESSFNAVVCACKSDSDVSVELLEVENENEDPAFLKRQVVNGVRIHSFGRNQRFTPPPTPAGLRAALETRLKNLIQNGQAPACVVTDMLMDWASQTVRACGLPSYVLYTCGAVYLAISFQLRDPDLAALQCLPAVEGLPHIPWDELPSFLTNPSHPFYPVKRSWDQELIHADGILLNTFSELEGRVLDAIKHKIPATKCLSDKIFPIGPLLSTEYFGGKSPENGIGMQNDVEKMCEEWLDGQEAGSVLYISFGSWAAISKEQMEELAAGLRASDHPVLWVLPLDSAEKCPEELKNFSDKRLLVLHNWAPQLLILGHRAVGGFLTHCGWNSVLESIAVAGVPVIAWPFTADQPISARYVVDELKIGVDVHENPLGLVLRDDVETAVRQLLDGKEAAVMRSAASLLHASAKAAVAENGSSSTSLRVFKSTLLSLHC